MQSIVNLVKGVAKNGFDKAGNGQGKRVVALLASLARNPNNARRAETLNRILEPMLLRKALLADPFEPYPNDEEFQGEMVLGLVGLHEPYIWKPIHRQSSYSKISG